ncbi:unnamed protein product [Caenorhabditis auriculariae]|uniref:RRM domain-containing protein n=1 Tax=Caenorhabditis auriculariae TaxID=2777116 RepID=A0A8S1GU95_9PELO|nr:unnamed protein product [Caenorhabditis auriculariae]
MRCSAEYVAVNASRLSVPIVIPPSSRVAARLNLLLSLFFSNPKIMMATARQGFSVYVGNIPYQTTENDIGNYFSQAGTVTNVRIVYDRETGRPKGFGFCEFADEAGAQAAVETLNGMSFNGRNLRVNYANK